VQLTATHCNLLQLTATLFAFIARISRSSGLPPFRGAIHFNLLQFTATHCNSLQLTQLTATHCNSLQHLLLSSHAYYALQTFRRLEVQLTATHCNSLQLTVRHCNSLQLNSTHCNSLQHSVLSSHAYYDLQNFRL